MMRHTARALTRTLMMGVAGVAALTAWMSPAAAYDMDTPSIITKNPTIGTRGLYFIQPGDTLWDLSEIFLGEPWAWPSLWSYNPQLTNPHWVYPGDMIQVRRPQPLSQTTIVWTDSITTDRKTDLEIRARYVGYLPERPFRESGRIAHARTPYENMGQYHEIYIEFGTDTKVKEGDRFTIYRELGPVEHPHDDDIVVGHRIKHLGIAKVLNADKKYVKALILESYEEIHRGDLITSLFPHSWIVSPTEGAEEVVASIVALDDPVNYAGQYQYVFLDKGRNDGVQQGNRFIVQRRGDGLWYGAEHGDDDADMDDFPWENLGEVMVVEAFEDTSLGIISRAVEELKRGERLYMPKGY
ncbi:MAG: LysM peptidoglycan-binding domain-containing protein [Myxococcota bacterium]